MGRANRRTEGDPQYPLEDVIRLASVKQIDFTRKALDLEAPRIMPDVLNRREAIRRIVIGLKRQDWEFAEEKKGGFVDVYKVRYGAEDIWLKFKLEPQGPVKKIVLVISFHEWDYTRPI